MILVHMNSSLLLGCLAGTSKISLRLFTSKVDDPFPQTPSIVKYLVDSLGLSSSEAVKCSKSLTHIKSPSNSDSMLEFFRKNGFTDADIKRIIRLHSRVQCAKVDSTLKPKFKVLRDLGFSDTQITKLITANPLALRYLSYCNVRPRIEFFNTIIDSNDDIVKALSRDTCLLASSLEKSLKRNIACMRECQFSNGRIRSLLVSEGRIIGRSPKILKFIVKRVNELGVPLGSGMFYQAFRCLCGVSVDMFDAKIKLLGSLGFSQSEVSAMLKQPLILHLSAKNLSEKVDFLVKEVGCELSYVSRHPTIIGLSMSKRLIPRHYVMKLIMERGLLKNKIGFYYVVSISERSFLK